VLWLLPLPQHWSLLLLLPFLAVAVAVAVAVAIYVAIAIAIYVADVQDRHHQRWEDGVLWLLPLPQHWSLLLWLPFLAVAVAVAIYVVDVQDRHHQRWEAGELWLLPLPQHWSLLLLLPFLAVAVAIAIVIAVDVAVAITIYVVDVQDCHHQRWEAGVLWLLPLPQVSVRCGVLPHHCQGRSQGTIKRQSHKLNFCLP
jgi:hypothetical protein